MPSRNGTRIEALSRSWAMRDILIDQVAAGYLERKPIKQIAEDVGVSLQRCQHLLTKARQMWLSSATYDLQQRVADELASIDHLETTYWEAYRRSLEKFQSTKDEDTLGEDGKLQKTVKGVRIEQRDGSPQFLAGIQWCIDRRCKLLGLDAPEKKQITGGILLKIVETVVDAQSSQLSERADSGDTAPPSTIRLLPK
jgi:hypothetical protein